jgi:hypothetical protein
VGCFRSISTSGKFAPLLRWISKAENCCASISISKLLKLAWIATMRGSTFEVGSRKFALDSSLEGTGFELPVLRCDESGFAAFVSRPIVCSRCAGGVSCASWNPRPESSAAIERERSALWCPAAHDRSAACDPPPTRGRASAARDVSPSFAARGADEPAKVFHRGVISANPPGGPGLSRLVDRYIGPDDFLNEGASGRV